MNDISLEENIIDINSPRPTEDLKKILPQVNPVFLTDRSDKIIKKLKSHLDLARKEYRHNAIKNQSGDSPISEIYSESILQEEKANYAKNFSSEISSGIIYAPWNQDIEKEIEKFYKLCIEESEQFRDKSVKYEVTGKAFQVFIVIFGILSIYISSSDLIETNTKNVLQLVLGILTSGFSSIYSIFGFQKKSLLFSVTSDQLRDLYRRLKVQTLKPVEIREDPFKLILNSEAERFKIIKRTII